MSELVSADEFDVVVDHRLFGLVDAEGQAGERPATPGARGLVAANATMLYLQTPEDVLDTRLRLELWDGPAVFEAGVWSVQEEVVMDLPSGRFVVDEIAAGGRAVGFALPKSDAASPSTGFKLTVVPHTTKKHNNLLGDGRA
ncbi:hypothetical protein PV721_32315, partial [Streptomyces sp. MB09-01]|uniref:hypothetical protein n=1 Tax=Streptomyces sp. MB09-01 TaxID=3028666 RepID=UPI0029BEF5D3